MSKAKRGRKAGADGRSKGEGKHVRLHRWLLQSASYRDLRAGPRAALVELYDLYDGSNNGALFLSSRDAADRLNVDKDTASAWLWDLEDHGFIKPKQSGSFDWKLRKATTWILAEFPYPVGTPGTKDFMSWKPGDHLAQRPRPGGLKNKPRSEKFRQTVREIRTAARISAPICPNNSDSSAPLAPSARPNHSDTGSIPSGVGNDGTAALPTSPAQPLPDQAISHQSASKRPVRPSNQHSKAASKNLGGRARRSANDRRVLGEASR